MLATTLVAIAQTRLELLSLDLEEEREHLLSLMVLTLIAVFLLGIGIVLSSILIVVVFWETHRLLVLSILTMTFLLLGISAGVYAVYKARTKPRLFTASLAELSKDRQQLESRHE